MVMMQVTTDCDLASTLASLPSLSLECLFCCEQWHLCFPLPGLNFIVKLKTSYSRSHSLPQLQYAAYCGLIFMTVACRKFTKLTGKAHQMSPACAGNVLTNSSTLPCLSTLQFCNLRIP